MTGILQEHWEVRCKACESYLSEDRFGVKEWSDCEAVCQIATKAYARAIAASNPHSCDEPLTFVHVIRSKRGAARREALEEVRGYLAQCEVYVAGVVDAIDRLAKEPRR